MNTVITRLKAIKSTPPNGLAVFCGLVAIKIGSSSDNISEETGGKTKMKKITVVMEPIRPIKHNLYHCDNSFHVEHLLQQLDEYESSESYGFIIVDGNGALYGKLTGTNAQILHSFSVTLPKKHSKGGQSSERFARQREEARHHYLKQVAEKALKYFIDSQTTLLNVAGIVIAGSANIKDEIVNSQYFDERLSCAIKRVVVVAYGGVQGFYQAIKEVQDYLKNLKFIREQKIVSEFMNEVCMNSNKVVYGIEHTMRALEMGIIARLILVETLPLMRVTFHDTVTDSVVIRILEPKQIEREQVNSTHLEILDSTLLLEYLVEQFDMKKLPNVELEIVSDKTNEGKQLAMGFSGIAGILRYEFNFEDSLEVVNDIEGDDLSEFI
jgi:peptide chain release factor subunit 1